MTNSLSRILTQYRISTAEDLKSYNQINPLIDQHPAKRTRKTISLGKVGQFANFLSTVLGNH